MEQLSFIPNSPTLMNAGDELQQLSACFVDSPDDDGISDIHQTAKEAAEEFHVAAGMDYAFWRHRSYGDIVGLTGGIIPDLSSNTIGVGFQFHLVLKITSSVSEIDDFFGHVLFGLVLSFADRNCNRSYDFGKEANLMMLPPR